MLAFYSIGTVTLTRPPISAPRKVSRVRFSKVRSGMKKSRFTDEQIIGFLK